MRCAGSAISPMPLTCPLIQWLSQGIVAARRRAPALKICACTMIQCTEIQSIDIIVHLNELAVICTHPSCRSLPIVIQRAVDLAAFVLSQCLAIRAW